MIMTEEEDNHKQKKTPKNKKEDNTSNNSQSISISILNKLKENAVKNGNKVALTFLKSDGNTIEQKLTYNDIENESNKLGLWLLNSDKSNINLKRGDR